MTTRSRHLLLAGLALITGCTLLNDPGKIEPGPDTTPPAAPTGLAALPGITQVTLTWDGSTEWDFDHFVVYSAQTTQTLVKVGEAPSPTFTITGLDNAAVYDFVVVAVDRFGNVSDPSTLVTAQPDGVAPTVVASYNPGPQSGANVMTDVIFTFSEPMDTASVEAGAVVTSDNPLQPVDCSWSWFSDNTEAKCDLVIGGNPTQPFDFSKTCTVTLNTGAKDRAGNALVGTPVAASFTTAGAPDYTDPTFTSATVATSGSATTVAGALSPGATGAFPETNVVITFSEAMNPTATQGAITVNGGPGYNGGAFTWDATGSVVTFNPDVNYPPGTVVTVTVGVGATDLAGNALAAAVTRYFRAAYQATETVASDPAIAGYGYSTFGGGSISATASSLMYAGDSSANGTYVGFISFPLTGFAHPPSRYKSAVLGVYQLGSTGAPYTDLRRETFCFPTLLGGLKCFYTYLLASHVNLGASLDAGDVTTAVLAGSWPIASSATVGAYTVDVVGALERDRLDGRTRNQWRLNFPTATDGASDLDRAWFDSALSGTVANRPTLVVTYEYAAP